MVIPDDYASLFSDSEAFRRLKSDNRVSLKVHTKLLADEEELIQRISYAHTILSVHSTTYFTARVLEACSSLRHIAVCSESDDNIAVETARLLDITISTIKNETVNAASEHTIALALAVSHRICEFDQRVRHGEWPFSVVNQLSGKILGLVGSGQIATRVIELAQGIGMEVIVALCGKLTLPKRVEHVDFQTLLQRADVISVYNIVSNSYKTRLFNKQAFAMMKPNAIFINTSRSQSVDESALIDALNNQTIAGAGLDVFDYEPLSNDNQIQHLPNVILSPHIAEKTAESLKSSFDKSVDNILEFPTANRNLSLTGY